MLKIKCYCILIFTFPYSVGHITLLQIRVNTDIDLD